MAWTLDKVCQTTTNPAMLNALHACRPGHRWNAMVPMPWRNAYALASQRREIPIDAVRWLRDKAEAETAAEKSPGYSPS